MGVKPYVFHEIFNENSMKNIRFHNGVILSNAGGATRIAKVSQWREFLATLNRESLATRVAPPD